MFGGLVLYCIHWLYTTPTETLVQAYLEVVMASMTTIKLFEST